MDRKTITVVVICVAIAVGYNLLYYKMSPQPPPHSASPSVPAPAVTQPSVTPPQSSGTATPAIIPVADVPRPAEKTRTLNTKFQEIEFTTYGAAIKKVTLQKTENGVISKPEEFSSFPAAPLMASSIDNLKSDAAYDLVEAETNDKQIVFQTTTATGLIVRKAFAVAGDYQLECKLSIQNPTSGTVTVGASEVSLGLARSLDGGGIYDQPAVDWYNGKVARYDLTVPWFDESRFLWLIQIHGKRDLYKASEVRPKEQVFWAATKNQYFATIVTPEKPAADLTAYPVELVPSPTQDAKTPRHRGIAASMVLAPLGIAPGQTEEMTFLIFSGPKEYRRLAALGKSEKFGQHQDQVLQFGSFIGLVAVPLLKSLLWLGGLVHNYGVAIIVITVLIKIIFWPVSAASMKSMKRMQKLQPLMNALKEKYKDDPQKMQSETMKLYREHKVNPLGGCLPMLIQIPVFFGLFAMLRGAIELRGSAFLWIRDLSQPDTVFHIPGLGLPFNPLPLLMTGTMIWQQKITPTTVDPKQAKMMMFMPLMMLLFFYNASSGLALYWTVQQILSVGQQYWMNAQKEEPSPATPPPKKKKKALPWKA